MRSPCVLSSYCGRQRLETPTPEYDGGVDGVRRVGPFTHSPHTVRQ
ncbi:hypothetical protein FRIGORI9N_440068 [Frigoribacterium sp. 9N]|nr:hypothetical protein FRIGORI9N_440068 [Frigoribacterium sp. 9N]